jgi:hypothetical protein
LASKIVHAIASMRHFHAAEAALYSWCDEAHVAG